jgi:hypothetical protein
MGGAEDGRGDGLGDGSRGLYIRGGCGGEEERGGRRLGMVRERRKRPGGRIAMGAVMMGVMGSEARAGFGLDGGSGVSSSAHPSPPAFYAGGAPEPGVACGGMGGGGMGVCLGGPVAAGGIGGGGMGVVRTGWGCCC